MDSAGRQRADVTGAGQAEAEKPDVCAISSSGGVLEAERVHESTILRTKIPRGGRYPRGLVLPDEIRNRLRPTAPTRSNGDSGAVIGKALRAINGEWSVIAS